MYDHHDYLNHYGVLGMKWGVRKDRKTYGRSRGKVKRQLRVTPGYKQEEIRKKYKKEMKEAMQRIQAEKKYEDYGLLNEETPNYEEKFEKWRKEVGEVRIEVAKKYVDEFNKATLKDIDYSDIQKGKEMLETYNLNYSAEEYGIVKRSKHMVRVI